MKPFDDHFADRVREVFDRHEESFDPAAWSAMNEILEKKRRASVIPMLRVAFRVAASLLIISVFSLVIYHTFFTGKMELAESGSRPDEVSPVSDPGQTEIAVSAKIPEQFGEQPLSDTNILKTTRAHQMPERESGQFEDSPDPGHLTGEYLPERAVDDLADVNNLLQDDTLKLTDIPADPEPEQAIGYVADHAGPQALKPYLATNEQEIDLAIAPYEDKTEKIILWGVTAGSMLTYAGQQLTSGISFTGGVTTEYRLSEKFRIHSGLLLAYQQFEVEAMPVSFHEVTSGKFDSSREMASIRTYADQEFEMLAVEIPVNVQFHLPWSMKNQWYLSTGFSSLLYLQQQMSGVETAYVETNYLDAASNSLRSASYASETIIGSTAAPLSRFDLARLLNISVGYAIQQEKTTAIVEPFVKIPLGAVSSQEIKMGMAGISLRLTFGK